MQEDPRDPFEHARTRENSRRRGRAPRFAALLVWDLGRDHGRFDGVRADLAFTDDEGFHVMAAQLIKAGMRPYMDFCFDQTPVNAYWNAFWMAVFGESWRTAHALAALETSAAAVLAAHFVLIPFPERPWRVPGAIAATMMIGCTTNLVLFGLLTLEIRREFDIEVGQPCQGLEDSPAVSGQPEVRQRHVGKCFQLHDARSESCFRLRLRSRATLPRLLLWPSGQIHHIASDGD